MSWDSYTTQVMESAKDDKGKLCLFAFIGGKDGTPWAKALGEDNLVTGPKVDQDLVPMLKEIEKDLEALRADRKTENEVNYTNGFEVGDMKFAWLRCMADDEDQNPPRNYLFMFRRKRKGDEDLKDEDKHHLYVGFANKSVMVAMFRGTSYQHESGKARMSALVRYLRSVDS